MERAILVMGIALFALWIVLNIVEVALGALMWILLAVSLILLMVAAGKYVERTRRQAS